MKINEIQRIGAAGSYKRAGERQTAAVSGPGNKRKDEVQISREAKELHGASGAAPQTPVADPRRQKLEELKRAVEEGTYRVDSRKLAAKLFPYLK
jgi:negative regulator of flagellin synthesis FlgM